MHKVFEYLKDYSDTTAVGIMASTMSDEYITYIFNIWGDCTTLCSWNLCDIGLLRQTSRMFNEKCANFHTKQKICRCLRFDLSIDSSAFHSGAVYGVTHYTSLVADDVERYIYFCKFIISTRPVRKIHDIIEAVKKSWYVDIIPFNQVFGLGGTADELLNFRGRSKVLSGVEIHDVALMYPTLTNTFVMEIFEYILNFRNKGFVANKNRNQLKLERNLNAIAHNKKISAWKFGIHYPEMSVYNVSTNLIYKGWIRDETYLKINEWTERSSDIRYADFVGKSEYYFKNLQVSF